MNRLVSSILPFCAGIAVGIFAHAAWHFDSPSIESILSSADRYPAWIELRELNAQLERPMDQKAFRQLTRRKMQLLNREFDRTLTMTLNAVSADAPYPDLIALAAQLAYLRDDYVKARSLVSRAI
jgi:hypothetical protein